MKSFKLILLLLSVGMLFSLANCGEKSKPAEPIADQQLTKLSKTWKLTSVTLNSNAVTTPSYSAFQLVMTGTKGATSFGYTTTGRPTTLSPWKASGTWTFVKDQETTLITRDPDNTSDKLDMTYVVSESALEISFNFTGQGYPGRTDQVTGNWVFKFGL
jgi:predicted small lipoprotein YifL